MREDSKGKSPAALSKSSIPYNTVNGIESCLVRTPFRTGKIWRTEVGGIRNHWSQQEKLPVIVGKGTYSLLRRCGNHKVSVSDQPRVTISSESSYARLFISILCSFHRPQACDYAHRDIQLDDLQCMRRLRGSPDSRGATCTPVKRTAHIIGGAQADRTARFVQKEIAVGAFRFTFPWTKYFIEDFSSDRKKRGKCGVRDRMAYLLVQTIFGASRMALTTEHVVGLSRS